MATPFAAVFAAFAMTLARMTATKTSVVGVPYGLRGADLQPLIGDFINMLPARVSHERSQAFSTTLDNVGEANVNVHRNSIAPFVLLFNAERKYYSPTHDPSRNPCYQTLIDLVPNMSDDLPSGMNGIMDFFLFVNRSDESTLWSFDGVHNTTVLDTETNSLLLMQTKAALVFACRKPSGHETIHAIQFPLPPSLAAKEEAQARPAGQVAMATLKLRLHAKGPDRPSLHDLASVVDLKLGMPVAGRPEEFDFIHSGKRFWQNAALAPVSNVAKTPKIASVKPRRPAPEAPRRIADDGNAYTKQEFLRFFGDLELWEAAPPEAALSGVRVKTNTAEKSQESDRPPRMYFKSWKAHRICRERAIETEGLITYFDSKSGVGFVSSRAGRDEVQFRTPSLPMKLRPKKGDARGVKSKLVLKGRRVGYMLYNIGGQQHACGLRFLDGCENNDN